MISEITIITPQTIMKIALPDSAARLSDPNRLTTSVASRQRSGMRISSPITIRIPLNIAFSINQKYSFFLLITM